jgi:TPR repeat protein
MKILSASRDSNLWPIRGIDVGRDQGETFLVIKTRSVWMFILSFTSYIFGRLMFGESVSYTVVALGNILGTLFFSFFLIREKFKYSIDRDIAFCDGEVQTTHEDKVAWGKAISKVLLGGSAVSLWDRRHGFSAGVVGSIAGSINTSYTKSTTMANITVYFMNGDIIQIMASEPEAHLLAGASLFDSAEEFQRYLRMKKDPDRVASELIDETKNLEGLYNKKEWLSREGKSFDIRDKAEQDRLEILAHMRQVSIIANGLKSGTQQYNAGNERFIYVGIVSLIILSTGYWITKAGNDIENADGKQISSSVDPQQTQANPCLGIEAIKVCRKAAAEGDATAQANLGGLYYQGLGVTQDYKEAKKWFQKAADQGNADAQFALGMSYHEGWGVVQNYKEAVKWWQKAADQGNTNAQFALGSLYQKGLGVKQDYQEAIKWYQKAADAGSSDAQNSLGFMYTNGLGVEKDFIEAAKWCQKAADAGNSDGQNDLGFMYQKGQGVTQDYAEAIKWYQKSADARNSSGQYDLGFMYQNGLGVDQDFIEAAKWYQKAADQGLVEAKHSLEILQQPGQEQETKPSLAPQSQSNDNSADTPEECKPYTADDGTAGIACKQADGKWKIKTSVPANQ